MIKWKEKELRDEVNARSSGAEPPQDLPTTLNTSSVAISDDVLRVSKITLGMLSDWGGTRYQGDTLPATMDKREQKYFGKRYKHLPEEFYKRTGLQVVTPSNFKLFMQTHRRWAALHGRKPEWDFGELYSCSGRLSYYAISACLLCGFPVDFRYGWDLRLKEHRVMLDEAYAFFKPKVIFGAPDCRLWCAAKRKVDFTREAVERQLELPALHWLAELCLWQAGHGRHYIIENPYRGTIFELTPLKKLIKLKENEVHRVDQCQHGAVHPLDHLPARKATVLAANVKMNKTALRCRGQHSGTTGVHSSVEGYNPNTKLPLTVTTAVYPRNMCHAIVQDVKALFREKEKCGDMWVRDSSGAEPPHDPALKLATTSIPTTCSDECCLSREELLEHQVFWKCKRCDKGKQYDGPHTNKPGCIIYERRVQREKAKAASAKAKKTIDERITERVEELKETKPHGPDLTKWMKPGSVWEHLPEKKKRRMGRCPLKLRSPGQGLPLEVLWP